MDGFFQIKHILNDNIHPCQGVRISYLLGKHQKKTCMITKWKNIFHVCQSHLSFPQHSSLLCLGCAELPNKVRLHFQFSLWPFLLLFFFTFLLAWNSYEPPSPVVLFGLVGKLFLSAKPNANRIFSYALKKKSHLVTLNFRVASMEFIYLNKYVKVKKKQF